MSEALRGKSHRKPRLLDLFCKAGGASAGYAAAGFEVVGVDIEPQRHYPFEFHQADALEFLDAGGAEGFDAVHASPPCQLFSRLRVMNGRRHEHLDLIEPTRERLRAWGGIYVIENVPGAPLLTPVQLCGSSFGLDLQRHRLFESNVALMVPPCAHGWQAKRFEPAVRQYSGGRMKELSRVVTVCGGRGGGSTSRRLHIWKAAMAIDWMTRAELSQAIPPPYTELLGHQLLGAIAAQPAERPAQAVG